MEHPIFSPGLAILHFEPFFFNSLNWGLRSAFFFLSLVSFPSKSVGVATTHVTTQDSMVTRTQWNIKKRPADAMGNEHGLPAYQLYSKLSRSQVSLSGNLSWDTKQNLQHFFLPTKGFKSFESPTCGINSADYRLSEVCICSLWKQFSGY